MKEKISKTIVLLALIAAIIYFAMHPEITGLVVKEKPSQIHIDKEVEKQLQKGSTEVIIFLKESDENISSVNGLEIKKEKAKIAQENFEKSASLKVKHKSSTVGAVVADITQEDLNELKNNPNVDKIIFPEEYHLDADTSFELIKSELTNNLTANGQNINGAGQTVCVVDSGIDYTHADFGSCTNDTFLAGNCQKVIGGYDFANNDADPMDDNSHGTWVSGIIAANGSTFKGIAPEAKIAAVKVCDYAGTCGGTAIVNGIDWCVNNSDSLNISVISMSLGRENSNTGYCDADINSYEKPYVDNAVSQGISVVVSSGNNQYVNRLGMPACLQNVTSVGATYHYAASSVSYSQCTDTNVDVDDVTCFSNTADILDVVAPGAHVNTTGYLGGYYLFSGTSAAAPHVSAAIALMRQYENLTQNTQFSAQEIEDMLKKSGIKITDERPGSGLTFPRLDVFEAVNSIFIINDTEKSIKNSYGKAIINTTGSLENASLMFNVGEESISLDSSQYPQFNVSANVTFYNLDYVKQPIILRDGIPCLDCLVLNYNGNLTFYVPHFTNYTSTSNSQLQIFDENDIEGGFLNRSNVEDTLFFANYTNATDNSPISTAECNVSYSDNISLVFTMGYNVSNGLYWQNKTFDNPGNYDYTVNCTETNYEPINLSDSITALPGCGLPPPNIDWVLPENSTLECNSTILYFQNQTLITNANSTLILRDTIFFLNDTSETEETITLNESSNFTIYNSTIMSNISGKAFNLELRGKGNIYNSTFNKSELLIRGNDTHTISNSSFLDISSQLSLEENTTNYVYDSNFEGYVFALNNSINYIYDSTFNRRFHSYDNSKNEIQNSTFSDSPAFYFYQTSTTNFTLPGSIISGNIFGRDSSKIYGYVDMPTSGTILVGNVNRFYPVWINYTNGSPAVNREVNITNNSIVVWSGTTDSEGRVYPNLTFIGLLSKVNTDPWFNISVNPTKDIGLLTDTPIIFQLDEIPPGLIVDLPLNNSNYNDTTITLNYSAWDDVAVDTCWYVNITGDVVDLGSSCSNTSFIAPEGFHNITVYVNDTNNNINSTQIFFTVDLTAPVVFLENPQNNTLVTNTNTIIFYYNVTDNINVSNATLIINDVATQTDYTVLLDTSQSFTAISLPNGQYNWSVMAYDEAGNWNISVTYNLTIDAHYCGDGTCDANEDCSICADDCGSCPSGGSGGGGGGGGGIVMPVVKENKTDNVEPAVEPPNEVIETTKNEEKAPVVESPAPIFNIQEAPAQKDRNLSGIIYGITGVIIAALLWYFPLFYFYRRTFAEKDVIDNFVKKDRLKYYRKLFVTPEVYQKYKKIFDEKKEDLNLGPIHLHHSDEDFINRIRVKYVISTELAKLITAAKRGFIARILTTEKISDELRKDFRKIKFENPFDYEPK
ncbi:S8 family serine peptidase [Candidatus Woesearchaeota archaeon]|nr:S8 family serine peptidase [Candidatus Woesearchaeota archaeon]